MNQECAIHQAENERDQALLEAKKYRNLAEALKKEKRKLEQVYVKKVETVRDFWRNKVIEGDLRGGKILQASLLQNFSTKELPLHYLHVHEISLY